MALWFSYLILLYHLILSSTRHFITDLRTTVAFQALLPSGLVTILTIELSRWALTALHLSQLELRMVFHRASGQSSTMFTLIPFVRWWSLMVSSSSSSLMALLFISNLLSQRTFQTSLTPLGSFPAAPGIKSTGSHLTWSSWIPQRVISSTLLHLSYHHHFSPFYISQGPWYCV